MHFSAPRLPPLYLGVVRDDCRLHLSEHHGDSTPAPPSACASTTWKPTTAELAAKAYKYARPGLTDPEWGTREMTIGDGFGNKMIFFRPR